MELPVFNHQSSIVNHKFRYAFTLVELLVVLAIMALIAALAVPALKNFGQSDAMIAAGQQLLGDVARARQLAMSQRTTVYMVFVPTNFWTYSGYNPAIMTTAQKNAATNLCGMQLTGYTFVSLRSVGDQPGQGITNYLAPWQTLPSGTFVAQQKFAGTNTIVDPSSGVRYPIAPFNYTNSIPFPTVDTRGTPDWVYLPYIAFNYLGQLTFDGQTMANRHEYIPLARGSVLPAIDPNTRAYLMANPPAGSPSVAESPPGNSTNSYNIIDIDPLTGRATLQTPKVQ